ncbi:MAG: deoxyribose-phosphate aldolase [Flavobacteriaceae bacterium]|nr:deoxyribose-phosphate aldolase [Flavobacteriaceae bacterium]
MKTLVLIVLSFTLLIHCKEKPDAQKIVDHAIEASGGKMIAKCTIEFTFRDRSYKLHHEKEGRILSRKTMTDSGEILDRKLPGGFERYFRDSLLVIPDSMARKYANSVNSVHYFAYLPSGLNDAAVNKEYLGTTLINGQSYYKIQITFDQEDGGEDFEDVFVYWFNQESGNPDYLAYVYHTDGGGMRFRAAQNPRRIGGIRFVDYENYKPKDKGVLLQSLDSLYETGELELLSVIALKDIRVTPDNYN